VAQAARLEARRGAGLDDAAVIRADLVDAAGKAAGDRYVQGSAPLARVSEEAPPRRAIVEDGQAAEDFFAPRASQNARLIRVEQVNRVRAVMAASPAGHAVGAGGIGCARDGR
jgi:hypothetical protein